MAPGLATDRLLYAIAHAEPSAQWQTMRYDRFPSDFSTFLQNSNAGPTIVQKIAPFRAGFRSVSRATRVNLL